MNALPPVVFARMTGLSVPRLREYANRGWLPPDEVDAATGYRSYHRRQVDDAILLRTLVTTGMRASVAARAVLDQDRGAVQAHLSAVEQAVAEARERLPVAGKQSVHTAVWTTERMLEPVEPGVPPRRWGQPPPDVPPAARHLDPLERVRWARRLLADATGASTAALPRAEERGAGLPDGPAVMVRVGPGFVRDEVLPRPVGTVLLPWPPGEPAPEGFRLVEVPGSEQAVLDLPLRDWAAEPSLDEAVAAVGAWLPISACWLDGLLLWDATVAAASLAVAYRDD